MELATKDAPSNDLHFNIKPTYTSPIDYLIQYRESDFEFINRLNAKYHEWFYYDGEQLNFGKPDKIEEVKLIYGRDLHSIQYGLTVAPLNYQKFAYNPVQDQIFSLNQITITLFDKVLFTFKETTRHKMSKKGINIVAD